MRPFYELQAKNVLREKSFFCGLTDMLSR